MDQDRAADESPGASAANAGAAEAGADGGAGTEGTTDETTVKPPVYWPVNDMGDNVSYLDNLSDEDVTTAEFHAKQVARGNRRGR